MPYFSRLTDIITCNLSSILEAADNPDETLGEIIYEMEQGVAGAKRSAITAANNVANIELEIAEQRQQSGHWLAEAQRALTQSDENQARLCLQRKHEVEDLIAGIEQQLHAAVSTREHLITMRNALEARLADAKRRKAGEQTDLVDGISSSGSSPVQAPDRQSRIDAELEAMRRQLEGDGAE